MNDAILDIILMPKRLWSNRERAIIKKHNRRKALECLEQIPKFRKTAQHTRQIKALKTALS